MSDIWFFMDKAIDAARSSIASGLPDVPVGCVIVKGGAIIASACNTRELHDSVTAHAEINAINEAVRFTGTRRLTGCKMFVTLEPCPMCAGAIRASMIDELYFGAYNTREGAAGTVYNILYPAVKVYGGIRKDICRSMLGDFFRSVRRETEG